MQLKIIYSIIVNARAKLKHLLAYFYALYKNKNYCIKPFLVLKHYIGFMIHS